MHTISFWASRNIWPARLLLAMLHIVLVLLAWILSNLLTGSFSFSLLLSALPFLLVVGWYLVASRSNRKRFHLLVSTGSFWLVLCFFQSGGSLQHALIGGIAVQEVQASKTEDLSAVKKKVKRSFFKRITSDKTGRTILTILTILGAILLLFLVAVLSCSIACSGAEALALLVGLAGLAGVIVLTRLVLRRIKFGRRQKDVELKEVREDI